MKALFGEGAVFGAWHHLVKKAIYMGVHVVFGLCTMAAACIWWRFQLAHAIFIITMVLASIYNASHHYLDQFRSDRERESGQAAPLGGEKGHSAGTTVATDSRAKEGKVK